MRASSRVASDEKCVRIMAKLLLLAVVCIFGCRMEQIHTQELADARGNTLFAESFSVSPLSIAHGRFKKISRLNAGKDDDTAKALQEKAAELRKEVDAFEASKQEESDKIQNEIQEKQREKDELRLRYSAEVPILKGDGTVVMERCDFRPRMTKIPDLDDENTEAAPLSRIIAIQAPLPLGIVLGQDEELSVEQRPTTIDAVADGGNGEKAGVRVGDCLRACTACQVTMEQPTWQLIAGGIGRPKTTRMMFSTDNKPFEQVMDAIASNAMDPESRNVWLVVERMDDEE